MSKKSFGKKLEAKLADRDFFSKKGCVFEKLRSGNWAELADYKEE
jgi:hypothetical protein